MNEVIYTKRYHFEQEIAEFTKKSIWERLSPLLHPFRRRAEYQRRTAEIDEIIRLYNDESELVEVPGAEQQVPRFIALGKRLSEELHLDVDILQKEWGVSVAYHIFSGPVFSDYMDMISELVAMATGMDILTNKNEPSDITISLELRTHEIYVGGKKILH